MGLPDYYVPVALLGYFVSKFLHWGHWTHEQRAGHLLHSHYRCGQPPGVVYFFFTSRTDATKMLAGEAHDTGRGLRRAALGSEREI